MMSGYSLLTRSSSHSFHNDESGAAVWHMLLMSIDLGSQGDFLWRWLGGFQKGSSLPNINSAVCLSSVCPVHIYLVPGLMYLQQTSSFFIFGTCHLLRTLSILPLTYYLYVSLTWVSDLLLVPICLSFTLFPGCLRCSDYFLTPLLYDAGQIIWHAIE